MRSARPQAQHLDQAAYRLHPADRAVVVPAGKAVSARWAAGVESTAITRRELSGAGTIFSSSIAVAEPGAGFSPARSGLVHALMTVPGVPARQTITSWPRHAIDQTGLDPILLARVDERDGYGVDDLHP